MPKRPKICVIGAGSVGATTAHWLATRELGDVVLLDILQGIPQGKGLDLMQASPVGGFDLTISGTNDYADTSGSDIVVITAGLPRKPGMSRDELLSKNSEIVRSITRELMHYCPQSFIIVVTNPLDAMAYLVKKISGLPRNRVVGMAGILDSTRFRTFVALELNVSVRDVSALVLGGHGDTMVPLPRYCSVAGIPLCQLLSPEKIKAIIERTRKGGGEIVNLLKTGSAYYAPSRAIVEMAEAVLKDQKRILPCSAYLEGEYGIKGVFVGVPVKLGAGGMEEIIEIELNKQERAAFEKSAMAVKELVSKL